jgi:hypothetical protein
MTAVSNPPRRGRRAATSPRQGDRGPARHNVLTPLVHRRCDQIYDFLAISVDPLGYDLAPQSDDIAVVDETAIFRARTLYPAAVTHPITEEVEMPTLPLKANVVLERYPHRQGSLFVVVDGIDRLEGA